MDGNSGWERSRGGLIARLHLWLLQPQHPLGESQDLGKSSQLMDKPINLLHVEPLHCLQDPPGCLLCPDQRLVWNFALRSVQVKRMVKLFTLIVVPLDSS